MLGRTPSGDVAIGFVTQKHNNPKDPLKNFFESYGFKVDWDFSRKHNESWNEVYWNKEMVLQIAQGVSLKSFKKWMDAEDSYKPPFFIASELDDKEFKKFLDVFYDDKKKSFKKPLKKV